MAPASPGLPSVDWRARLATRREKIAGFPSSDFSCRYAFGVFPCQPRTRETSDLFASLYVRSRILRLPVGGGAPGGLLREAPDPLAPRYSLGPDGPLSNRLTIASQSQDHRFSSPQIALNRP